MARYCGDTECENRSVFVFDTEKYCPDCGKESTPAPLCLGRVEGKACTTSLNLKALAHWTKVRKRNQFCTNCGTELTPDFLGKCMKAALDQIVKKLAAAKAAE